MFAATLGAVGTIVVGLAAAWAAIVGQRGANRATQSGTLIGGYSTLVDQVQEERDRAQGKAAEAERLLLAAYADLARERAEKAELLTQINRQTTEIARLRERVVELGGQPP